MNPYLLTLSFLLLMSILTSSEVVRFSQHSLGNTLYTQYQKSAAATDVVKIYGALEDFRARNSKDDLEDEEVKKEKPKPTQPKKESVRRSISLRFNLNRPPNNSRLNLYLLLHEPQRKDYPLSLYEVTARLMRSLYGETTFFKPGWEYRILEALNDNKEQTVDYRYPDEFATFEFDDPELQHAFYLMLKGGEGTPPLLNFLTFDKEGSPEMKKVNLLFADPRLIEALVDNPPMAERLVASRDALWEKILDYEAHRLERPKEKGSGRNAFKRELREDYERILEDYGLSYDNYKWVFDLGLGKLGNILFIEDPHTGLIRREKHTSRVK